VEYWVTAQDKSGVLYFGSDDVISFDGERWIRNAVPGSYAVRPWRWRRWAALGGRCE